MKIVASISSLVVVSSVLFTGTVLSQRSGSANLPFSLEITPNLKTGDSSHWDFGNTSERSVKAGSMVVVEIRKINRSDHNLPRYPEDGGPYPWLFSVHDSQGNVLKSRPSNFLGGWIIGSGTAHLKGSKDNFMRPGEAHIASAVVSNGYNLSKPGVYTIQATEHVSNDPESPLVKSNEIRIQILPDDEERTFPDGGTD